MALLISDRALALCSCLLPGLDTGVCCCYGGFWRSRPPQAVLWLQKSLSTDRVDKGIGGIDAEAQRMIEERLMRCQSKKVFRYQHDFSEGWKTPPEEVLVVGHLITTVLRRYWRPLRVHSDGSCSTQWSSFCTLACRRRKQETGCPHYCNRHEGHLYLADCELHTPQCIIIFVVITLVHHRCSTL